MTAERIEFWLDLSSPYAYFAAQDIDALAERYGRQVHWKPFLLGPIFKRTGAKPLTAQPLKGDYARRDWERLARLTGVPFTMRAEFPLRTHIPARMVLAVEEEEGAEPANAFARHLINALFAKGEDIADISTAAAIGEPLGLVPERLAAAADEPRYRDALRQRCDEAEDRGICGAPWLVIDGEPFWGADRLPLAEHWLSTGGW